MSKEVSDVIKYDIPPVLKERGFKLKEDDGSLLKTYETDQIIVTYDYGRKVIFREYLK